VNLRRFVVRPEAIDGTRLTFDEQDARHMARALRLTAGTLVAAVDGTGREYTVRLESVGAHTAMGIVLGAQHRATESPLTITLAQGVPKGDKMDRVVRAATELGVDRIVPVLTARTIVRLDAARWRERARRWQRIAREAAKQSGRAAVPSVDLPTPLPKFLEQHLGPEEAGLRICCWEGATGGMRAAFEAAAARPGSASAPATAVVLVGPEGGLAVDEVESARGHGFTVSGLGPRLLRTETAGPAVIAVLQSRFGDLTQ
jgi:16S rRNA (uracil1498-N3)-methyltransferase